MTLASVPKVFTATAVGLLIDDFAHGRNMISLPQIISTVTWSTKIKDVLPDWSTSDPIMNKELSIRDALPHMSGIPRSVVILD
jgi:CubicO group peptidase (beta-lactamase class C family)